jgi:outer membrane protein assembly factor BamB
VTHWEYTSPSLWNSGGKTYILGNNGQNVVCCLDLETGKDLWTLKYNFPYALLDFAVRADSDLLASEGKLYRMTPGALQPLKTFLDVPQMRFGHEQIIVQDHLYQWVTAQEGSKPQVEGLCCFELKTGDLKWSNKSPTCTWGTSTPAIAADGKIIMAYGSDYIWGNWGIMMLQANPEKFVQLGAFEAGMIPWSNPALAEGALFLRTETGLSCYDLRQK